MSESSTQTIVLIISGPAGSGKTTLCDQMLGDFPDTVTRLVTTTSREPRPGEIDGVDYHFLPAGTFKERIEAGEFIEWAKVHGRYYGSQKRHIIEGLASGKDLLLNIDVQGADAFRRQQEQDPDLRGRVHTIFIKPASVDQLHERLRGRGTDDEAEIQLRLESARKELREAGTFDAVITSGSREADYAALLKAYARFKKGSTP